MTSLTSGRVLAALAATLLAGTAAGAIHARSADDAAETAVAPLPPGQPAPLPERPVVDDYFGTKITDPYRYIEKMPDEVKNWMRAEAGYTRSVFDSIAPRAAFEKRLGEMGAAFSGVGRVRKTSDSLFAMERPAGADQYNLVIYDGAGAKTVLIDSAQLIADAGHPVAIDYYSPSPDGSKVMVGLSDNGSEQSVGWLYDVATKKRIAGPIFQGQISIANWAKDSSGMFLTRMQKPTEGMSPNEIYLNGEVDWWVPGSDPVPVVGTSHGLGPNEDPVKFPLVMPIHGSDMSVLTIIPGVKREFDLYIAPTAMAKTGKADWRQVVSAEDEVTDAAATSDRFYFLSHKDAPGFKVTSAPLTGTAATAEVVIPEKPGRFLSSIVTDKDSLYIAGRDGLQGILLRVANGKVTEIPVPVGATLGGMNTDDDASGLYYSVDGFTVPNAVYHYDPATGTAKDMELETRPADLDLSRYKTLVLDATATDGVKVPLSVLVPAGESKPRPFLLASYGAYGINYLPYFDVRRLVLADAGAGFAMCHPRGGGVLGEEWRLGGKDALKYNTWRDTIACARELIAAGLTTPDMLTLQGTSAGGITVGMAAIEQPELFAGIVSRVGSSNPLRSIETPGGPANLPEFGDPRTEEGFRNLLAMDPYQHLKKGTAYPPFLITTGMTDPRVAPWIPTKFAARLMESSTNPVLLRIDTESGHGMGTARSIRDREEADIAAFVFWQAGLPDWQPQD